MAPTFKRTSGSKRQKTAKVKKTMSEQNQTKEILKLNRAVKQLRSSRETKVYLTGATGGVVSYNTNAATYNLTAIANGNTYATKVGNSIRPFFISIKGAAFLGSGSAAGQIVRVTLIRCKQRFIPDNSSIAASTKVWEDAATARAVFSPKAWDSKDHFDVLSDQYLNINLGGTTQVPFTINKKLFGESTFDANSSSSDTGCYYLIYNSTEPLLGNPPTVTFSSRLYFKDS